jgi:hypothetical protein
MKLDRRKKEREREKKSRKNLVQTVSRVDQAVLGSILVSRLAETDSCVRKARIGPRA